MDSVAVGLGTFRADQAAVAALCGRADWSGDWHRQSVALWVGGVMAMPIERINSYEDSRFDFEVLAQHGAFLLDEVPVSFLILDNQTALVCTDHNGDLGEVINKFRFYTEHIYRFISPDGTIIREFEPKAVFSLNLEQIQPSQFYVDQEKVDALNPIIGDWADIIIPVMEDEGRFIAFDGHTRLAIACQRGYECVKAFYAESDETIHDFAAEAQRRGVFLPSDLKVIEHAEFDKLWNQFCDDFFSNRAANLTD